MITVSKVVGSKLQNMTNTNNVLSVHAFFYVFNKFVSQIMINHTYKFARIFLKFDRKFRCNLVGGCVACNFPSIRQAYSKLHNRFLYLANSSFDFLLRLVNAKIVILSWEVLFVLIFRPRGKTEIPPLELLGQVQQNLI